MGTWARLCFHWLKQDFSVAYTVSEKKQFYLLILTKGQLFTLHCLDNKIMSQEKKYKILASKRFWKPEHK